MPAGAELSWIRSGKLGAFCAGGVEMDDFEVEVLKVATGQGPFCECPQGRGARQFRLGVAPFCECPQEENAVDFLFAKGGGFDDEKFADFLVENGYDFSSTRFS